MKKIIIANWKMQLGRKESRDLAKKLVARGGKSRPEVVICPSYASLETVSSVIKGSGFKLGAQDSGMEKKGAYTGEVSPLDLASLGVKYVILGHSERREHLHENSTIINRKIKAALSCGLIPILCIGEKWEERKAGKTQEFLDMELRRALKGVKIGRASSLVIAYEPVWAISTNQKARPIAPEEANAAQAFIKRRAKQILRQEVRVIYGGSASPKNQAALLAEPYIDGLLVGGASLKAEEFKKMIS